MNPTPHSTISHATTPGDALEIKRFFTTPGTHPFDAVEWELRDARIGHGDRVAFEQELAQVGVEDRIARIGQNLFLPALLEFGSEMLKGRYVRPTILGEILWCQGFSEPDAG